VSGLLSRLAERRPLFHSERDLQHELAGELSRAESVYARVDHPVQVGEERFRLDVLAIRHRGERERVGFELRYLTRRLAWTDPATGEDYQLRDLAPHERLAFLLDIGRIERAVRMRQIDAGCSLLVSNDDDLWAPAERPEVDAWLAELLGIYRDGGALALAKLPGQSSDGFWWGLRVGGLALAGSWPGAVIVKDPAARQLAFEAFRRLPYVFEGEYPARWRPYSELAGAERGRLRYLAVIVR